MWEKIKYIYLRGVSEKLSWFLKKSQQKPKTLKVEGQSTTIGAKPILEAEVKTTCIEKVHDVVCQAYVMNVKDDEQGPKESYSVSIGRDVKENLEVIVSKEK